MSMLSNVLATLMRGSKPAQVGPVPGAMGNILASMGIHEFGPNMPQKGVPASVLGGCRKGVVPVPKSERPAMVDGKPMISRRKGQGTYQVVDTYGISLVRWKGLVNDQKRKHAGRYVGPFPTHGKKAEA